MLRVVLCIICLHPFLWLFLFALLYHTVKDFFVLILLKTCEFCMVLVFLDGLQISWRRWALFHVKGWFLRRKCLTRALWHGI